MDTETRKRWLASRTKHGAYNNGVESAEHYTWRTMIARCCNPNSRQYQTYGGRGITVCARWLVYENFLDDMGPRPDASFSLDRINNDSGYAPENCRWATRSQQQKNKTTTSFYTDGTFVGTLVECAARLGISKELAHWRWATWNTFEKGQPWQKLLKNV